MKITAALVAAVGAAAVVGVGVLVMGAGGDDRTHAAVAVDSMHDAADVRREAQQLYERFAGDVEQRNAGYVVAAYRRDGAMDACMDDAGYPQWDWSEGRDYAAPTDALGTSTWFAEPMRRTWSETLAAQAPGMVAEGRMNGDARWPDGYEAAIDACLAHNPVDDPARGTIKPPGDNARLVQEWWAALREAGEDLVGDDTAYVRCMDVADIPVLGDRPYDDIGPAMSGVAPAATDIPTSADDVATDSPGWQRYLAAEDAVIAADWGCRKAAYEEHLMGLADVIEGFAADHADDIVRAERRWRKVVIEAAALGYDGKPGPLGG